MSLSPEYLRSRLRYDEELGGLVWLPIIVRESHKRTDHAWNVKHVGKLAGLSLNPQGYRQLRVGSKGYLYHRVLWAVLHGEWPLAQIDHIDRDPLNNHPSNLRLASPTQNNANHDVRIDSETGIKGVQKIKSSGKWRARIRDKSRSRHIGCFDTPEQASAAYAQEARRVFGEFASVGG